MKMPRTRMLLEPGSSNTSGNRLQPHAGTGSTAVPARTRDRSLSRASRGKLVAQLLAGAWRASPPASLTTAEDLAEIAVLLLKSGASALAWHSLRESQLRNCPAASQLHQAYRLHSLQGAISERSLKQVIPVFRSFGAEPVLVKGWATARLYPEPGLRPYCDLDLCVSQDHYAAAKAALKAVETAGAIIDLHVGFGKFYERKTDRIFERTQLVKLGELDVRVLCPEDDLRFLCLHFLRHGAIRPLWLADIAVLLETRRDDFDWDLCLSGSSRHVDWVACAIGLAYHLLGADIQGVPVWRRVHHLPSWLVTPTLKAWGTPVESPRQVAAYLHHPISLPRELIRHWPNPTEATMTVQGPFNHLPRLAFQLAHVASRSAELLRRLLAGSAQIR